MSQAVGANGLVASGTTGAGASITADTGNQRLVVTSNGNSSSVLDGGRSITARPRRLSVS